MMRTISVKGEELNFIDGFGSWSKSGQNDSRSTTANRKEEGNANLQREGIMQRVYLGESCSAAATL